MPAMDLGVNDGLQLIDEGVDQMTDGQEDVANHDETDFQRQMSGSIVMKRHPVILAQKLDENDDYQKGDVVVVDWDHNFLGNALKSDDIDQGGLEFDQRTVTEREDDHELDLRQYANIDDLTQTVDTYYYEQNNQAVAVVTMG